MHKVTAEMYHRKAITMVFLLRYYPTVTGEKSKSGLGFPKYVESQKNHRYKPSKIRLSNGLEWFLELLLQFAGICS